jgi:hypothetical protein
MKKKTHEQYESELWFKESLYWPVEQYKGSNIKILHECLCGNIWYARPCDILRGMGCKNCYTMSMSTTKNVYLKQLPEDYELLGEYTKITEHALHKHTLCGHEWLITPKSINQGTRCPNCYNISRTKTDYLSRIPEGYEVLESYIKSGTPIKHKHIVCGHEWLVAPDNFIQGTRCPACAVSGFKPNLMGYLYFVELIYNGEIYFKIGITNNSDIRKRFGKDWVTFNMRLLWLKEYVIGKHARDTEQRILREYSSFAVNENILKSGNTEILSVFIGEP